MDSTTLLPPTASQTGFIQRDSGENHSRGNNCADDCLKALHIAARVDDDTRQVQQEVCNSAHHVTDSVERNGMESRIESQGQSRDDRATTERMGHRNVDATERFGLFTRDAVDRNLHAIDKNGCDTRTMIADYGYRNLLEGQKVLSAVQIQACETREVVKDRASILERQAADNFAVITRQAAENTHKIELNAQKNANDLQMHLSECCCELKELVREKSDEEKTLILKLDSDRIRDELNRAREELTALRLRVSLPPMPVSAIAV